MKKIILGGLVLVGAFCVYKFSTKKSETDKTREKHMAFYKNHPYQKTARLSKAERKKLGIPPNAYYQQKYLNQINPNTGELHPENLFKLQEELNQARMAGKVPGEYDNSWIERGPNNIGGRTRALIFDPNDPTGETVIAGGVAGGLWKNTNISNPNSKWKQLGVPENLAVSCIKVDPNNSRIFYVGTGESHTDRQMSGNGLWKSTDGGNSWTKIFGGITGDSFSGTNSKMKISSPSSIAGTYAAYAQFFGSTLKRTFSGDVVLAQDSSEPKTDGCDRLTNASSLKGKIALMSNDGTCRYDDRALSAQNAGAIGVLIYNTNGRPIKLRGTKFVDIPVLSIGKKPALKIMEQLSNRKTVSVDLSKNLVKLPQGNVVPGAMFINDIELRNNAGRTEVYVAVGESLRQLSRPFDYMGADAMGLYKSTDGNTFQKIELPATQAGNPYEPNNLEIDANNDIYLSTTESVAFVDGGGVIFKSTDGDKFDVIHEVIGGLRTEIVASKKSKGLLYVLSQMRINSSPVKIFKTTNGFSTVSSVSLPNDSDPDIPSTDFTRGQSFYDLLIYIDPNNDDTIYAGGIDLFKSTNGGFSWNQISRWHGGLPGSFSVVHADQHTMVAKGNKLIFGNDGGVYYSDDAGKTITSRNNGYNVTQFYSLGVAPTTAFQGDYIIAGAQDNGSQVLEDADNLPAPSREAQEGDGAGSYFDQDGKDRYMIYSFVYNMSTMLYDYDTQKEYTISTSSQTGDFINQQALDSNLDILYANHSRYDDKGEIAKFTNLKGRFGADKDKITSDLMNARVSAVSVSPYATHKSNVYVGLINGKVIKIENANTTPSFKDISGDRFIGTVSDIEFGKDEREILVTMTNYGVVSVWYTKDAGYSWSNKEGDLPDIPVNTIVKNPLNDQEVIVGTDLGVWRTFNFTDEAPSWKQSYNGMSNVIVNDLDVRNDNVVFAATHGRGIFSGKFTRDVSASVENVVNKTDNFTVFPSTSNGNFTVFAKPEVGNVKMNIYNLGGKKVYSSNLDFNTIDKHAISVNLASGMYIVTVDTKNNKRTSKKIVIQ